GRSRHRTHRAATVIPLAATRERKASTAPADERWRGPIRRTVKRRNRQLIMIFVKQRQQHHDSLEAIDSVAARCFTTAAQGARRAELESDARSSDSAR